VHCFFAREILYYPESILTANFAVRKLGGIGFKRNANRKFAVRNFVQGFFCERNFGGSDVGEHKFRIMNVG
jgi:hypothetical protein